MSIYNLSNKDNTESVRTNNLETEPLKNVEDNSQSGISNNTDDKEKKVLVDGPLSVIYAQALNIAYAKESVADGQQISFIPVGEYNEDEVGTPDMYVYATDQNEIDKSLIDQHETLRVALDKYKDKDVVVVLEATTNISSRVAALEEYVHSSGVTMSYKRHIAIRKIIDKLGS